jgi:hypothetical protein
MPRVFHISIPSKDPKTGRGPTLKEKARAAQKKSLAQREQKPISLAPEPEWRKTQ